MLTHYYSNGKQCKINVGCHLDPPAPVRTHVVSAPGIRTFKFLAAVLTKRLRSPKATPSHPQRFVPWLFCFLRKWLFTWALAIAGRTLFFCLFAFLHFFAPSVTTQSTPLDLYYTFPHFFFNFFVLGGRAAGEGSIEGSARPETIS